MVTSFLLWRLVIFIPLIIGEFFIPIGTLNYIFHQTDIKSFISTILNPWANFDGIHYLRIAEYGYVNEARFFPLFPLLLKIVATSLLGSVILVSVIFFLALFFLKKLINLDYSNQISTQSIIYLLIFPTSFFFVSIYSEGLFLLLTILSFYFARKRMWLWAIIFGMFLTLTRFVGIAILPALLYEFLKVERFKIKTFMLFSLIPFGIALFSLFNLYKWNNLFFFIQAQGELGNNRTVNTIVFFPQTVFRYIKILSDIPISSYDWNIALLEVASFIFASILLYLAWKNKIRTSYLIFALTSFAISTSTGTFSGLPRYIIILFPIFITLALIKNKIFKSLYTIFSPTLLFILLMLFSRGYYIA